jgi:hypothetical protein
VTVELPQRTETDRPVPGDPADRAEELIIKEARRRRRRRVMLTTGIGTLVIAGLATGMVIVAGHRSSVVGTAVVSPSNAPRPSGANGFTLPERAAESHFTQRR